MEKGNEGEKDPSMSNQTDPKDSLKTCVLLVDDNRAFLRAATDFVQRQQGLVVVGAICGGEEVLARVQDLQPQVILIGLDIPGLETISCLRNTLPDVSIIALTLLNDKAYRQVALAAGADDLVRKAELTSDLLPAIRRVIQNKGGPYETS